MSKNKKIKGVYFLKNAFIRNLNNDAIFDKQSIIEVEFEDDSKSYLDLKANTDISDIEYFEVFEGRGITKRKKIFKKETKWL